MGNIEHAFYLPVSDSNLVKRYIVTSGGVVFYDDDDDQNDEDLDHSKLLFCFTDWGVVNQYLI